MSYEHDFIYTTCEQYTKLLVIFLSVYSFRVSLTVVCFISFKGMALKGSPVSIILLAFMLPLKILDIQFQSYTSIKPWPASE